MAGSRQGGINYCTRSDSADCLFHACLVSNKLSSMRSQGVHDAKAGVKIEATLKQKLSRYLCEGKKGLFV